MLTDPDANTVTSDPPRLIVGMSRAATTWLCKCLNEHTQACAFGESLFWGRRYMKPQLDGRYSAEQVESLRLYLRRGGSVYAFVGGGVGGLKHITMENIGSLVDSMVQELPREPTPGQVFRALSDCVARAEGKRCAVEKTPHHLIWHDRILRELPRARLIVMVREPYGFMLSYKHYGDEKDEAMRARFRSRYHPLGNAIVWKNSMRSAMVASTKYPAQTLVVRFEEIERDPVAVLTKVQEFFGLSVEDLASRVPPDNTSFAKRSRPELSADDVFWMNLVAGRVIQRAGWQLHRVKCEPLRIVWSFVWLPWWAIVNIVTFRHVLTGSVLAYFWRWMRPGDEGAARVKS